MTIGTMLYTMLRGELVGTDEFGNRYYRNRRNMLHGRERRWVIYKGEDEASQVPAEWHSWLHHTTAEPLTEKASQVLPWQKTHVANQTGSSNAYRPSGHDLNAGRHAPSAGDYEAWSPE